MMLSIRARNRLRGLLVLCVSSTAVAEPAQLNFLSPHTLQTAPHAPLTSVGDPSFVDLNADGIPDLLSRGARYQGTDTICYLITDHCEEIDYYSPTLDVYFTQPDGSLQLGLTVDLDHSSPALTWRFVHGAFDDDDMVDIVWARGRQLNVLLNNGAGEFAESQIELEYDISSIDANDINIDGRMDLVLRLNAENAASRMLQSNGDGTFSEVSIIDTHNYQVVFTEDMDGDGIVDWVLNDLRSDNLEIIFRPSGGDDSPTNLLEFDDVSMPVLDDFTGDGMIDILYRKNSASDVMVLLQNLGDGQFLDEQQFQINALNFRPSTGDFNGDGFRDLLVPHDANPNWELYLGKESGIQKANQPLDRNPRGGTLSIIDINNDGMDEIIALDRFNYHIEIHSFSDEIGFSLIEKLGGDQRLTSVAFADTDKNGYLDILGTSGEFPETRVQLWYADAQGRYIKTNRITPLGNWGYSTIRVTDANRDGMDDVVLLRSSSSSVQVRLAIGDGYFSEPLVFNLNRLDDSIVVADFNGDENVDILTFKRERQELRLRMGFGDGNFGPDSSPILDVSPSNIFAFDANRDRRSDYLVLESGSRRMHLFLSDESGHPGSPLPIPLEAGVSWFQQPQIMDVNNDDIVDLVARTRYGQIEILLGRGDGTFTTGPEVRLDHDLEAFSIGDLNDDGHTDILVQGRRSPAEYASRSLINNHDGTFTAFNRTPSPIARELRDINHDGFIDVLSYEPDISTNSIPIVFSLDSTGNKFGESIPLNHYTGNRFRPMTFGDFNGDNRIDILHESETYALTVTLQLPPGAASPSRSRHSADLNANSQITLSEVLRVIQLYYFGSYACADYQEASEDGYELVGSPPGDFECTPHSIDYAPQDWRIGLTELMRAVQLYNAGGYTYCAHTDTSSEDGYCPGPPAP